jgi:hypothetical protein
MLLYSRILCMLIKQGGNAFLNVTARHTVGSEDLLCLGVVALTCLSVASVRRDVPYGNEERTPATMCESSSSAGFDD